MRTPAHLIALLLAPLASLHADDMPKPGDAMSAFKTRLHGTLASHLNRLLREDGSVAEMKGKTSKGDGALASYLMFEITGGTRFRAAALSLADQVLKDMRATKHGVLPIKEKDKPGGATMLGGGPPALGAYAAGVAHILHREGGRDEDLKYIATVLDRYPWNEEGWWANTMDVATGESKLPMTTPAIINKTAAVAMAAGIVSGYVRTIAPEHATRGTPKHYAIDEDVKRSFQLGLVLIGGGHLDEGIKIMTAALDRFPLGNAGQDGAHAAEPSALVLSGW